MTARLLQLKSGCLRCWLKPLASVVSTILVIFLVADMSATAGNQEAAPNLSCFSSASAQNGSASKRTYLLSPGDQLEILVYQREDLSGAREVGEDGMISLPLLGRLNAAGKSVPDLEALVTTRFEQTVGRAEDVTIQLPTRRPVYVVGLVNRPGAYPFATNMTVLHAVALSGGLYRPDATGGGLVGVLRENARISDANLRLKQNLALQARLQAELEAGVNLEPPQRLITLEGKAGARQLINRQVQIMEARETVRKKQIAGLEEAATLTQQEITSLTEREGLIVDQINLARKELAAYEKLKQKGLLRRADLFTIHRIISGLEADRRAVQARIVGAKRRLLETEERLQLFDTNEKLTLEQEINQTEFNIASSESAIRASQWIVGELNSAAREDENQTRRLTIDYQIIRSTGERRHQFQAQELSLLCPGDIVRVQPSGIN